MDFVFLNQWNAKWKARFAFIFTKIWKFACLTVIVFLSGISGQGSPVFMTPETLSSTLGAMRMAESQRAGGAVIPSQEWIQRCEHSCGSQHQWNPHWAVLQPLAPLPDGSFLCKQHQKGNKDHGYLLLLVNKTSILFSMVNRWKPDKMEYEQES